MTPEAHAPSPTNLELFRVKVVAARRQTGRLQKELADALGINAQVLSRKLHGVKQTFPTHAEVKQIIKVLAAQRVSGLDGAEERAAKSRTRHSWRPAAVQPKP